MSTTGTCHMATPTVQVVCLITMVLIVAVDATHNDDTINRLSVKETSGDGKPIIAESTKENGYLQENSQFNVNREDNSVTDKVRTRVKGEEESILTTESGKERTLSNEKAKQTTPAKISSHKMAEKNENSEKMPSPVQREIRKTPVTIESKSTTPGPPTLAPTKTERSETPISSTTTPYVPVENEMAEGSGISSDPTPLESSAPMPIASPKPSPELSSVPTPLKSSTPLPSSAATPLSSPEESSEPMPLSSSEESSKPTPLKSPEESSEPSPITSSDEFSTPMPLAVPEESSATTPFLSPDVLSEPSPTTSPEPSSTPPPLKPSAPKPNSSPTPLKSPEESSELSSITSPEESSTQTSSTSPEPSSTPPSLKPSAPKPNSSPRPLISSEESSEPSFITSPEESSTQTSSTSPEPSSTPPPLKPSAPKPNSSPTPLISSEESSEPSPKTSPEESSTQTSSTSPDPSSTLTPLKPPAPKPNSTPPPTQSSPKTSSPARILALIPYNARSHFAMFEALFRALAARGHHVDVLSHFAPEQPPPNYRTLSVLGAAESWEDGLHVDHAQALGALAGALDIWTDTLSVCEKVWEHPTTQKLLASRERYDLVISEIFGAECMMGFAHKLQTPLVGVVSSVAPPGALERMDNPENPAFVANYFLPYSAPLTLWQRLTNALHQLAMRRLRPLLCDRPSDALQRRYLGEGLPPAEQLRRNTSLVLVNSHFSANQARPLVPGVVEVGGLHVTEPRPLPPELQRWVESSPQGVVVFSLGTMVRVSTWAPDRLQALWQALGSLPQRVLIKSKDPLPGAPHNVRVQAWLPQRDLLAHRNVVGLVTHGGLMGLQEAVWEGVPMLGVPMFADQRFNLVTLADKGVALMLEYQHITNHSLTAALHRLVTDPELRSRTATLSSQFRDRPLSARATAVWWVEYVLRHRGAPHLRSPPAQDDHHDHNDLLLLLGLVALTGVAIVGALLCLRRGGRERGRRRKEKTT